MRIFKTKGGKKRDNKKDNELNLIAGVVVVNVRHGKHGVEPRLNRRHGSGGLLFDVVAVASCVLPSLGSRLP